MISYLTSKKTPISFLCKHFGVSRSGYYNWQKEDTGIRSVRKIDICKRIKALFKASDNTYGSPRIYFELKSEGILVSKNTVAKYMKEMSLNARYKKKYRVKNSV